MIDPGATPHDCGLPISAESPVDAASAAPMAEPSAALSHPPSPFLPPPTPAEPLLVSRDLINAEVARAGASFLPGGLGSTAQAKAHYLHGVIQRVESLKKSGCSQSAACLQEGIDDATYIRWRRRYKGTWESLLERPRGPRRQDATRFLDPGSEAAMKLSRLYLATMGAGSASAAAGRRTGKVATTLWLFAHEPECPVELKEPLLAGAQPAALVRYLKRVTPEMEACLRGARHFQMSGHRSQRDMSARLPDGHRALLVSGSIWEFDDMSVNQPFYWEAPTRETFISRQGLYCRDLRSGRWLGVELIARPREAYRAEDILRFFRRLFELYGKPRRIRLEKSVWAARSIRGLELSESQSEGQVTRVPEITESTWERPEMPEAERQLLQDGLAAIGVQIDYARHAHLKVIETAFNPLQTVLATRTMEFVNIGRHAGEFEAGAKALRRVRAGSHHPRDVGLAHIDILADRIDESFTLLNARPTKRLQGRTPDDIWAEETAAHPLTPLDPRDLPVFLAELREGTVRGGAVWPRCGDRVLEYRHEKLATLGTGYKVWLRFDPTEPALGAAVYNAETGDRAFLGHREGELICLAEFTVPAPQCQITEAEAAGLPRATVEQLYGAGVVDRGDLERRKADKVVRTAFRAQAKAGQPAARASTIRDGRGNVASVESGSAGARSITQAQRPAPSPIRQAAEKLLARHRPAPVPKEAEWI